MAEAYTKIYINTCLENRANVLKETAEKSHSEGAVMHLNRSCKLMGFLNNEGGEYLTKELGIPYVSFDGDQTDPRNYSEAQYETRVQALVEMIQERK